MHGIMDVFIKVQGISPWSGSKSSLHTHKHTRAHARVPTQVHALARTELSRCYVPPPVRSSRTWWRTVRPAAVGAAHGNIPETAGESSATAHESGPGGRERAVGNGRMGLRVREKKKGVRQSLGERCTGRGEGVQCLWEGQRKAVELKQHFHPLTLFCPPFLSVEKGSWLLQQSFFFSLCLCSNSARQPAFFFNFAVNLSCDRFVRHDARTPLPAVLPSGASLIITPTSLVAHSSDSARTTPFPVNTTDREAGFDDSQHPPSLPLFTLVSRMLHLFEKKWREGRTFKHSHYTGVDSQVEAVVQTLPSVMKFVRI